MSFVLLGGACAGVPDEQQIDYEEDVKPLIEELDGEYKVRGSCNVIGSKSTCVDYIGSFWDQPNQKELNCQGAGVYSDNTCPYTEVGGCQSSPGTMVEVVIWHYDHGGEPFGPEEAKYAAMACNALPVSQWTTPDQIFLK